MQAPWPIDKRKKILEQHLVSLQLHSPTKHKVAVKFHSVPDVSEKVCPVAPEKKPCPLLATCFGNRSAALYELGQTKVMHCPLEDDGRCFIQRVKSMGILHP